MILNSIFYNLDYVIYHMGQTEQKSVLVEVRLDTEPGQIHNMNQW